MKFLHNLFIVSIFLVVILSFVGVLAVGSIVSVSEDRYPLANPHNELGVEASAGVLNNDLSRSEITSLCLVGEVNSSSSAVDLGTAGDFAILSESGITTTGTTAIVGDIGVSPIGYTSITGFSLIGVPANDAFLTSLLVNGKIYAANLVSPTPTKMTTAIGDMRTAYTNAGVPAEDYLNKGSGNLAGLILAPGVYKFTTGVLITSDVYLNGNSTDKWIFQIPGTLDISSGKKVILTGGAQANNIVWAVAGATTLGTYSTLEGNILDKTNIAIQTGAILNGRALSQTEVTLDASAVTKPTTTSTCPDSIKTDYGYVFEFNQDGSFTYYTDSNTFHGVDYFDYFASDGSSNSSIARVWIGVNNSVPVVSDDRYSLANPHNELGVEASAGVLNNDKGDADNDAVTLKVIRDTVYGTLYEFNQDGSFTYYTDSNTFHGVDYFEYLLSDGYSNSTSARVVLGINDTAPVALQDKYLITNSFNATNETGSMVNDFDLDGDQMFAHIVENVHFGKLKTLSTGFSVNGSFNYTSNKSNGVDFFSYYVTDLYFNSKTVKTIFVIGTNTAPVANNDIYNYDLSTKNLSINTSLGVLANDIDAEKDILFAELVNDSNLNGTLHFNEDGSFVYYPKIGFAGVDSFTYKVTDLDMNSSIVSVRIYVNYSGIENLIDDMGNETSSGQNITINFTSKVYPLTFFFKLFNESNIVVSQSENYTANNSSDLPGIFTFPSGLLTGQYTLYLYVYDVSGDLVNETIVGVTNYTAPSLAPEPIATASGGGGSSSCNTQWITSEWSECIGGTQTRTVSYPVNYCTPRSDKPLELRTCIVPATNQTSNTTLESENQQPSFFNTITGNVIGTTAGRVSLGILAFLILVGLAWWIVAAKKRRAAAEKPVKVAKLSAVKSKK